MIEFVVDSRIHTNQFLPKEIYLALRKALSFANPDYVNRKIFGRSTWNVPREICLLDQKSGRISIPRGSIGLLRKIVAQAGYDSKFINNTDSLRPIQLSCNLELRDYQELAVTELVNSVQGCLIAPCGAGKTVMGTAAIARINQPALVLVHTADLLEQWVEAIEKSLSIKPGIIAGGLNDQRPVTVAMVQSLSKMALRAFGTVILDECAHCPAITFRNVLDRLPGKYRFGLTATPDRADGLGKLLELCIGPIAHQIGHQQLIDAGHLVVPDICPVNTRFTPRGDTYSEIIADIIANDERNDVILQCIRSTLADNRATLVLSNRVDHCHEVVNRLISEDLRAAALTSRVPKRRRKTILDDFRGGELEIVCATSLADEGLDISRLECLILATPAKAEGRTIQRLGRLMRPHPGKRKPVLYDLVDNHPIAQKQFVARRRAYRKVLNVDILAL